MQFESFNLIFWVYFPKGRISELDLLMKSEKSANEKYKILFLY